MNAPRSEIYYEQFITVIVTAMKTVVVTVPKTTLYVLGGLLLKMKYTTTNHQHFSSLLILLNEDVRREIIK